jgi:hypothetical protein
VRVPSPAVCKTSLEADLRNLWVLTCSLSFLDVLVERASKQHEASM